MWLGRLLFGARSVPGRQWSGKHRRVRKVTGHMKFNRVQKMLQIREVEKMIAVPYLTVDEEYGHIVEKKIEKQSEFFLHQRKMRNFGLDVLGANSPHAKNDAKCYLDHLNVAKKWNPVD